MTDLDTLVDMGFDKARAELAVKQSGGRKLLVYPYLAHLLTLHSPRRNRLARQEPRKEHRRNQRTSRHSRHKCRKQRRSTRKESSLQGVWQALPYATFRRSPRREDRTRRL